MDWWFAFTLVGSILLLPTAYAGIIGAPWAPTRIAAVKKAFDSIGITQDDLVVDLGCGDGKILAEAASRGARGVGYELSPIMWVVAFLRTGFKNGVSIRYGNFFKQTIPADATMVFIFLMPKHMEEVRVYLAKQRLSDDVFVLSYAFPIQSVPSKATFREKNCAPLYMYSMRDIR